MQISKFIPKGGPGFSHPMLIGRMTQTIDTYADVRVDSVLGSPTVATYWIAAAAFSIGIQEWEIDFRLMHRSGCRRSD